MNKIQIRNLTGNITKNHLQEIFQQFSPRDIEYTQGAETALMHFSEKDAQGAIKYMDGGNIDGNVVSCKQLYQIVNQNSSGEYR